MLGVTRVVPEEGVSHRRKYIAAGMVVVLLLPFAGLIGAQGAQNWCQGGETSFPDQDLSLSAWPPGVHCLLDVDERGPVERYWPINW